MQQITITAAVHGFILEVEGEEHPRVYHHGGDVLKWVKGWMGVDETNRDLIDGLALPSLEDTPVKTED